MLDCLRFNAKTHISLMRHHGYAAGGSSTDTGAQIKEGLGRSDNWRKRERERERIQGSGLRANDATRMKTKSD